MHKERHESPGPNPPINLMEFERDIEISGWSDALLFFKEEGVSERGREVYGRFRAEEPERFEQIMERVGREVELGSRFRGIKDFLKGEHIWDDELRMMLKGMPREQVEREKEGVQAQLEKGREELVPMLYDAYIGIREKYGFDITSIN